MGGLKNRFPPEVFQFWVGWYMDLISGKNNADCLHHVKSQGSRDYKFGEHNKSILNSCPLNNFETHLYNPKLHADEIETMLLQKIIKILLKQEYQLKPVDVNFYQIYEQNYLQKL